MYSNFKKCKIIIYTIYKFENITKYQKTYLKS